MGEVVIDLPVVEARDCFNLNVGSVGVSGPLSDAKIQLSFWDDFARNKTVRITGQSTDGTTLSDVQLSVETENVRVHYGSVKISLETSKELVRLLSGYIEKIEALSGSKVEP